MYDEQAVIAPALYFEKDGKTIVFERHFSVWKLDTRSGKANEIAVSLRGAPSAEGVTHTPLTHWRDSPSSPVSGVPGRALCRWIVGRRCCASAPFWRSAPRG